MEASLWTDRRMGSSFSKLECILPTKRPTIFTKLSSSKQSNWAFYRKYYDLKFAIRQAVCGSKTSPFISSHSTGILHVKIKGKQSFQIVATSSIGYVSCPTLGTDWYVFLNTVKNVQMLEACQLPLRCLNRKSIALWTNGACNSL